MDRKATIRIQVEAAKALAGWKSFFAEQVALKAKEIVNDSDTSGLITLEHYRHAAILAAQALAIEVQNATGANNGGQKAA